MKASLLFSILTAGVLFFISACKEKPAPAPVLPGVVAVPAAEANYAEYMPSIRPATCGSTQPTSQ